MPNNLIFNKSYTMIVNSGAGIAYFSEVPEFKPGFCGVCVFA